MENRPVARGSAKRSFFGHKMGQKWCCFYRKVSSKVFLSERSTVFVGAPHPSKINHGYGPGGKTVRLAISTAVILKEEGCCRVKNSAVNRKLGERALFCLSVCLFFFLFLFCFLFRSFVCLFDFFNHLVQALNWFQKEPPRCRPLNKMKNKYRC